MLQKVYWDPRYDHDFLRRAMVQAEAGIYYGTAKTYMEARFRAALDVASERGYDPAEISQLLRIAGQGKAPYQPAVLETAHEEGVDPALIKLVSDFLSKHHIYPETLNAIVMLPDVDHEDLPRCASSIVSQAVSLRASDCTNANKLWIHRDLLPGFMAAFEEEAGKLTYGDVLDPRTRLAQYDSHYLRGTQGIVNSSDESRIIAPTSATTGERATRPINPDENYTGVIVTELDVEMLLGGDPVDQDTFLSHLSKELPIPWFNVIAYDDVQQVLDSMQGVLAKYTQRCGYPRYLYVAAMGGEAVESFEQAVIDRGIADLFKKGEEAYRQFLYYRPHQGSFFINELVR